MSQNRIEDIKSKIKLGYMLEDLKKEYPITKALFIKLGGIIPVKPITMNADWLELISGKDRIPEKQPFDNDVL